MGKASRRKAERRSMKPETRRLMREMIKESSPEVFVIEDKEGKKKMVYYNPLKKLLEGEAYKSEEGFKTTNEMVKKYNQFLKTRLNVEKIAKDNGVDPETVK